MPDYLTRVAEAGARTSALAGSPSDGPPILQALYTHFGAPGHVAPDEKSISSSHQFEDLSGSVSDNAPVTAYEEVRPPISNQVAPPPLSLARNLDLSKESAEPVAKLPPEPGKPVLSESIRSESPPIPRQIPVIERDEKPRFKTELSIPEQPPAQPTETVRLPGHSGLTNKKAASEGNFGAAPKTVHVRLPKGLRPQTAADEKRPTQGYNSAIRHVDLQSDESSLKATEPVSAAVRAPNRMESGTGVSDFAPSSDEREAPLLEDTESVLLPHHRDADAGPLDLLTTVVVGSMPTPSPQFRVPGNRNTARERTEPSPQADLDELPAVTRASATSMNPDVVSARAEPRSAKLTIGRIDIDVHVQPPSPVAAQTPPAAKAGDENLLDQHYVDRFGLRL